MARWPRTFTATDLRLDMDTIAAPPTAADGWIILGGVRAWEASEHDAVRSGVARCPVCGGAPRPSNRYCSFCDAAGLDGRVSYPGLGVDESPDPDYPREGPAYRPGVLRGGRGGRSGRSGRGVGSGSGR